jgi:hypothetical protein
MKKFDFIGICLLAVLAVVIGGFWRYMAKEGSVQLASGLAVAEAERPCATDHYYVSLNEQNFACPKGTAQDLSFWTESSIGAIRKAHSKT